MTCWRKNFIWPQHYCWSFDQTLSWVIHLRKVHRFVDIKVEEMKIAAAHFLFFSSTLKNLQCKNSPETISHYVEEYRRPVSSIIIMEHGVQIVWIFLLHKQRFINQPSTSCAPCLVVAWKPDKKGKEHGATGLPKKKKRNGMKLLLQSCSLSVIWHA